jgi:hypothetical protein
MDVRLDGDIHVSLSERNLEDLAKQAKGAHENPYVDGEKTVAQLVRVCTQPNGERVFLRVTVEKDDAHYGERRPGPGGFPS